MINLNKYSILKLHKDKKISKKIEAVFLLYDRECDLKGYGYHSSIKLINHYIQVLLKNEEYEVVEAFINRKRMKMRKYRKTKRRSLFKLYLRYGRMKISLMKKF